MQQQHLALAEEKKSHAREIAGFAHIPRGINAKAGNRPSNQTPDQEMTNANQQDDSDR